MNKRTNKDLNKELNNIVTSNVKLIANLADMDGETDEERQLLYLDYLNFWGITCIGSSLLTLKGEADRLGVEMNDDLQGYIQEKLNDIFIKAGLKIRVHKSHIMGVVPNEELN